MGGALQKIGPCIAEALDMVGMSGTEKRLPVSFPGTAQRVAMRAALAIRPKVLSSTSRWRTLEAQLRPRRGRVAEGSRSHAPIRRCST